MPVPLLVLLAVCLSLGTSVEYRRSIMHKKRNYLLEISNQDSLAEALSALGIYIPGEGW